MNVRGASSLLIGFLICVLCIPILADNSSPTQSTKDLIEALGAAKTAEDRTKLLIGHQELVTPVFVNDLIEEADRLKLAGQTNAAMSDFLAGIEAADLLHDRHLEATAMNGVAEMYRITGQFEKAMDQLQEALALSRDNKDNDQIAESLANMGRVLYLQGNLKLSEQRLRESIEISRSEGNKNATAATLNILGLALSDQGETQEALDTFQESVTSYQQAGNNRSISGPFNNMARLYALRGDYDASMESLQKALEICQSTGRDADVASILLNMGNLYADRGNYRLALSLTEQGMARFKSVGDPRGVGDCLNNIGELYQNQGNLDLAREFYEKAESQYKILGAQTRVAVVLRNIGSVYGLQNKRNLARKYFDEALMILQKTGDKEGISLVLSMIAYSEGETGEYELSLKSFQESLKLSEEVGDIETLSQTSLLLAETYQRMKNYSKALETSQNALAFAKKIPEDELIWQAQAIAGEAYMAQHDFEGAQNSLQQAIQTIENQRTQIVGGEQQMQQFLEMRTAPYYSMVELSMQQNQPDQALAFLERAKARVLLDVMQSGKTLVTKSMTPDERQKEKKLSIGLADMNKRILLEEQKPDGPDAGRLKALRSDIDHARLEFEAFHTSLFATHPELRIQRGNFPDFRITDARTLLMDNSTALVEFMVDDEKTLVFVITGSDPPVLKVYPIAISKKNLGEMVDRFRQQLAARDPLFRKSAQAAFRVLLAPASKQLNGKTRLIIVPDADLWQLPFQALLRAPDRYLIDDAAISYAPSFSVLREMQKVHETIATQKPNSLLAFGNPAFGNETARPGAYRTQWNPLPESEKEVKEIAALYSANASKVFVGAEAREDQLKASASSFQVLHMATHGTFNDASPMYSYLVLSQLHEKSMEDGMLEAWEILNMELKFNLVILSACETARGRYGAGEGMIGLTWAFFVAGCPTTVVSQWKVESASTSQLMVAFHKYLKTSAGNSAEALRKAELSLRNSAEFSHPFYWAPFVVVGAGF